MYYDSSVCHVNYKSQISYQLLSYMHILQNNGNNVNGKINKYNIYFIYI